MQLQYLQATLALLPRKTLTAARTVSHLLRSGLLSRDILSDIFRTSLLVSFSY